MAKDLLVVDSRRRVTLPNRTGVQPGDVIELECREDGTMILTPIICIPKHQVTPEVAQAAMERRRKK